MGVVRNISINSFPKQSEEVGEMREVYFHYDTSQTIIGKIIRDDLEEPYRTILELVDGRIVLATECMYQPIFPKEDERKETKTGPQED